jgi:dihydroorotate dehydrogenase subfamily 1
MADLTVSFLGMKLKNPLIMAAGPLSRDGSAMKKALDAGVGAVITETIVNEASRNVRPRLVKRGDGLQNIRLYSEYSLEEWAVEIGRVKDAGGVCIANILGHTPSETAYIASFAEKAGADGLELNFASPHGEGIEVLSADPERVSHTVGTVVAAVGIPVMVKLSPNVSNIALLAKVAEHAGAAGVSAINTVRSIIGVDIESGSPLLPTFGGYSGDPIRPIGLAVVATVAQAVSLEVSGIGGVSRFEHILEYMMLGAGTVQIMTSVMLNGLDIVSELLEGLTTWLDTHGYASIGEIQGKALPNLKSFEEIPIEPYTARLVSPCPLPDCRLCETACVYGAIDKAGPADIRVHEKECTDCGLCVSVCPKKCFQMVWKE